MITWASEARRKRADQRGFTLIELLVVVVILGILAAVVVFAVRGTGDKGAASAVITDRRTIRTAEEAFCAKNGRFGTEQELVAQQFLSEESTLNDVTVSTGGGPCGNTNYTTALAPPLQTLTVGFGADPWRTSKLRLARFSLDTGVCETLAKIRNDYSYGPGLATSWELIDPGTNDSYPGNPTWRFHLRQGVKFHNSVDFKANAVKYSMDRLVTKGENFTAFIGPDSSVIVDDYTIDITPQQPNYRLVEILVHQTYAILGLNSEPSVNNDVVCTGPFKFKNYVLDDRIEVERFADYWGEKAKLSKLTFRFIPDSGQRRTALETGAVDAIFDVGRQQVAPLRGNSRLKVVTAPTSAVFLFYENINGNPPYDKLRNENIRRALALSIDRQAFVNENWAPGSATLVNTPSPSSILGPYASMNSGYTYDLTQARQLLVNEGWVCTGTVAPNCNAKEIRQKGGTPLNLYLLSNTSDDLLLLQDLKSRAADAGINIQIGTDGTNRSTRKNAGEWDLDTSTPNQNDSNPAFLLTLQWYNKSQNPWKQWQEAGSAVDTLIDQALAAPNYVDTQNYAAQAMNILVDQRAITVPLAGINRVYGLRVGVEGFEPPHPAQSHVSWASVYRTS